MHIQRNLITSELTPPSTHTPHTTTALSRQVGDGIPVSMRNSRSWRCTTAQLPCQYIGQQLVSVI